MHYPTFSGVRGNPIESSPASRDSFYRTTFLYNIQLSKGFSAGSGMRKGGSLVPAHKQVGYLVYVFVSWHLRTPPFSHSITVEGDSEGAHRTSLVFSHALSDMQSRTADNRQWTYAEPAP